MPGRSPDDNEWLAPSSARVSAQGWVSAVRRMRRLDRQRLAILLSLCLLALATLAAVNLHASGAALREEARQANHLRVVQARDELRVVQVEFWQGVAQGRRTLQTDLLERFLAGRDALAASLAMDRDDPEIQSLAHRSLNDLDRVAALAAQVGSARPIPRRVLDELARIERVASPRLVRWAALEARRFRTQVAADQALAQRLTWLLSGVVALIVLSGVVTWRRLDRSRAKLAEAASEAAASLQELAATDPLTGLANRRELMARLPSEIARAEHRGGALALVLLDVDHFKSINDRHGHPTGDAVLVEIAARVREACRRDDLVARIGGEELALLLPGADAPTAARVAAAAHRAVGDRPFPTAGRVTVSAGWTVRGTGADAHRMLADADRALLRAKGAGRDRVMGRPPAPSDGAAPSPSSPAAAVPMQEWPPRTW